MCTQDEHLESSQAQQVVRELYTRYKCVKAAITSCLCLCQEGTGQWCHNLAKGLPYFFVHNSVTVVSSHHAFMQAATRAMEGLPRPSVDSFFRHSVPGSAVHPAPGAHCPQGVPNAGRRVDSRVGHHGLCGGRP